MPNEVTPSALEQALSEVENFVKNHGSGRQEELMQKALNKTITDAEKIELAKALSGVVETPNRDAVEGLSENDILSKAARENGAFDQLLKGMQSTLESFADDLDQSNNRNAETLVLLARGFVQLGKTQMETNALVKSLSEQISTFGRAPGSAPRSIPPSVAAPGGAPVGEQPQQPQGQSIDRREVLNTMMAMAERSGTGLSKSGFKLAEAITNFETRSILPEGLAKDIAEFRKSVMS